MWIEQFLEAKLGSNEQHNHPLAGNLSDLESDDDSGKENEMRETSNSWKRDSTKLTYQAVKKFLAEAGIDAEPNYDKEKELMEEIEGLRDENLKLRQALEYFRRNAPDVKPPPFMLSKEWDRDRQALSSSRNRLDDEDEETEEDEPAHRMEDAENHMEMQNMSSSHSADADEKAKSLTEIFPSVTQAVALIALRRAGNSLFSFCCPLLMAFFFKKNL